jgi:hypothetical protein
MTTAKTRRKSTFVPRLVMRTAVVAVVPACAVACGGETNTPAADAAPDHFQLTVAAVGYPAYEAGGPRDAFSVADAAFGVAAVGYPAYEAGHPLDASVADAAYPAHEAGKPVDSGKPNDSGPRDAFSVAEAGFSVADAAFSVADAGFGGPKDA